MNQDSNKRPVTLEDILRLKRAERPPAEFWDGFDRELRAKQLAALVEKRPWWRSAPALFSGFSRYHLPLGATAVLAITFFATRDFHATRIPVAMDTAGAHFVRETTSVSDSLPSVDGLDAVATSPADAPVTESVLAGVTASEVSASAEVAAAGGISASRLSDEPQNAKEESSPSARYIQANLVAAQAAAPVVTRGLLGLSRGFEARAFSTRVATVEPLQQMATPAQTRSARLMSAMVSMSNDLPARTSERVASRISGDQLYDGASRFGALADRFLLKF